jgi:hypothetical protein
MSIAFLAFMRGQTIKLNVFVRLSATAELNYLKNASI